jgi:dUTP pyrophosphatase
MYKYYKYILNRRNFSNYNYNYLNNLQLRGLISMKSYITPFPKLQIKKLVPEAIIPTLGSVSAAGYDLYSIVDLVIEPKQKSLVSTGIAMAIPEGNYGRVAPRSGLACKNFIDVGAGVIDADYRGEVKVLLFNFGDQPF